MAHRINNTFDESATPERLSRDIREQRASSFDDLVSRLAPSPGNGVTIESVRARVAEVPAFADLALAQYDLATRSCSPFEVIERLRLPGDELRSLLALPTLEEQEVAARTGVEGPLEQLIRENTEAMRDLALHVAQFVTVFEAIKAQQARSALAGNPQQSDEGGYKN